MGWLSEFRCSGTNDEVLAVNASVKAQVEAISPNKRATEAAATRTIEDAIGKRGIDMIFDGSR